MCEGAAARDLGEIVVELYDIVARLEDMFPGRHFTPDGHLIGSLGEVYAAEKYGLELLEAGAERHDAVDRDGRLVQIKVTQRDRIALSDCPDYLVVLTLSRWGEFEEVYNGPGEPVWVMRGKPQKTSQFQISVRKLRMASLDVADEDRIRPIV